MKINDKLIPQLHTSEDIDLFFNHIKAYKLPINRNLDIKIRMSMHKIKLQQYYSLKLKEYTESFPSIRAIPSLKGRKQNYPYILELFNKTISNDTKNKLLYLPIKNKAYINNIVSYFKENEKDLTPVTDYWIRSNITNKNILSYYYLLMSITFNHYQCEKSKKTKINIGNLSEKRRQRIINLRHNLLKYINNIKEKEKAEKEAKEEERKSKILQKKDKQESFEYLQTKKWILDWNCVKFKDGYFCIFQPIDGSVRFAPKKVIMPEVLESFNYLKEYLNKRLRPVLCSVKENELTIVDRISLNEAIEKFSENSRQRAIKVVKKGIYTQANPPYPMSFQQAISRAQQMTSEEFKKYKSKYIDYLLIHQSNNYKVIPCVERLAYTTSDNTEYAFLFTIECSSELLIVIYENVNPDRSTLLFFVKTKDYNVFIKELYEYLQSAEINKRSCLRGKEIRINDIGVLRYCSINHNDINKWESKIMHMMLMEYANLKHLKIPTTNLNFIKRTLAKGEV